MPRRSGEIFSTQQPVPSFHPFLPASLPYLDVLARGERPPFEPSEHAIATIFERRTADAFRCLGFEISQLGRVQVGMRMPWLSHRGSALPSSSTQRFVRRAMSWEPKTGSSSNTRET